MVKLQQRGWKIGIRFEPMIFEENYQQHYAELFKSIFSQIDIGKLESVSLGLFRMPENFYKNIVKLYPEEKLFASPVHFESGQASYTTAIEEEMLANCRKQLLTYIPENIYYHCAN
jgi:spore photoproduct lyase